MPRILQVLANPFIGGTETFAINLSSQLSKSGVANHILNLTKETTPFTDRCRGHGIPLTTLGDSARSPLYLKKALGTAISDFKPNVILSFGFRVSMLLRFTLPSRLRSRHLTGLRGLDTWRRTHHTLLDSLTESRVAYFVGVSNAVLEQRRTREQTPIRKLLYIPNGIDTFHFRPNFSPLPPRGELGLPEGRIFLTVANFREEKGHRFLLEAISNSKGMPEDVKFVWVGGGRGFDQISKLVADSPVANKITLLPPISDVRNLLRHASLFILPSREEGMPRALMEAMAMSVPILATRVGGVPELFKNEPPGHMVTYGDKMEMASKLQESWNSNDLASGFGKNARQVIERDFDLHSMTERYIHLFKLVAEENSAGVESFRLSQN
jgi:glycosyltransferase involved in cell wall biosynthesis